MTELPHAAIARLMKNAGAKRVSVDAVDFMIENLEEFASDISKRAFQITQHSGRKTVMSKDIKLATR